MGCIFNLDAGDCKRDFQFPGEFATRCLYLHAGLTCVCAMRAQLFNEIMPVIYKRFTEKEARDWRQIYKVCPDTAISKAHLANKLIRAYFRLCNFSNT